MMAKYSYILDSIVDFLKEEKIMTQDQFYQINKSSSNTMKADVLCSIFSDIEKNNLVSLFFNYNKKQ